MNKIENDTDSFARKEDKQNSNVLWWMKKGKNAIYIQFVNNIYIK
jgi:hypothetical protein